MTPENSPTVYWASLPLLSYEVERNIIMFFVFLLFLEEFIVWVVHHKWQTEKWSQGIVEITAPINGNHNVRTVQ